jgi:hypothetical protein
LSVEALDGLFGVRAVLELDERKTAWAASRTVNWKDNLRGWRDRAEIGAQIRFRRAVR